MNQELKKKAPLIIVMVGIVVAFGIAFTPKYASETEAIGLIQEFGGRLVDVDYTTCPCSLMIIFTVEDVRGQQHRFFFPYALQLLEKFGIDFGIFKGLVPRIYEACASTGVCFIPGYEVNVVGNYFRYNGPPACWVFCQNGCCPQGNPADGFMIGMGTSLLPSTSQ